MALLQNSVKIIIGQSRPDAKILDITPTDLDLTNAVYHKSEILGLKLIDHIVISNVSIKSKKPFYCSHLENGAMYFVQTDMTYKSYNDIKPELDKAKKEEVDDALVEGKDIGKQEGLIEGEAKGIDKRTIEIAKTMLKNNVDIDIIISSTGLTKKEIDAIGTQSEN